MKIKNEVLGIVCKHFVINPRENSNNFSFFLTSTFYQFFLVLKIFILFLSSITIFSAGSESRLSLKTRIHPTKFKAFFLLLWCHLIRIKLHFSRSWGWNESRTQSRNIRKWFYDVNYRVQKAKHSLWIRVEMMSIFYNFNYLGIFQSF